MVISYSRIFKKMFRKQPLWLQNKFEERIFLFAQNIYHPLLNNHALDGKWKGCMSINIAGDLRAVFEEVAYHHIEFIAIGSHSELFS